jgi:hypothetical protein
LFFFCFLGWESDDTARNHASHEDHIQTKITALSLGVNKLFCVYRGCGRVEIPEYGDICILGGDEVCHGESGVRGDGELNVGTIKMRGAH